MLLTLCSRLVAEASRLSRDFRQAICLQYTAIVLTKVQYATSQIIIDYISVFVVNALQVADGGLVCRIWMHCKLSVCSTCRVQSTQSLVLTVLNKNLLYIPLCSS